MARQARLAVAGRMHYVLLRGHNGMVVMTDGEDRRLFLQALREALTGCTLHGFALLDSEVHLLLRPAEAGSLSRDVQALGRRFVAAYNRRHGRSGTPWDGRFRAAVVEPGAVALAVTQRVDQLGSTARPASGLIVDPPEWWALGNTPFEREQAYQRLLAQSLPANLEARLDQALRSGSVIGSSAFVAHLAEQTQRPLVPRRRGRPARAD
jgi:putative transposase